MRVALINEVSCYDLYNIFDTKDRGFLLLDDFVNGLRRFGIKTKRDEPELVMRSVAGRAQKLTFSTFSKLFLPREPEYREVLEQRKGLGLIGFARSAEHEIGVLLAVLITVESKLESARQKLDNSSQFNLTN